MSENVTKMVMPCICPHCATPIVIGLEVPHPTIDIMLPEEVSEDIKNLIANQNDITEEPDPA